MLNRAALAIAATVVFSGPLFAQELPAPTGEVLLTVSGNVKNTNVGDTAQLDMGLLQDMESTVFETSTIWTDGIHQFEGVTLKTLVERLGIDGQTLVAAAINDYMIEIPVSDATENGPIVAYFIDGGPMSIRDKGPLWIVYPYDSNSNFQSEEVYSRSVWQLDRIEGVD